MTIARCVLALAVSVAAAALGQGTRSSRDPKFGAATTAVVIDVVVRDAKGRPVTDLTRADFELLEDGVLQELGDVTRVGVARRCIARAGHAPAVGRAYDRHGSSPDAKRRRRRRFSRSSSIG